VSWYPYQLHFVTAAQIHKGLKAIPYSLGFKFAGVKSPQGSFTIRDDTNIPIYILHYACFDSIHLCQEYSGETSKGEACFCSWTNPINTSIRAFVYSGSICTLDEIPSLIKTVFIFPFTVFQNPHSEQPMKQIFWKHGIEDHFKYWLPIHIL
jgi:hypothetical protein